MNKYKDLINKEIDVLYKNSKIIVNLRVKGILLADVNNEIIIRCTGEINNGMTKVIKYEDIISVEKN